ncbi:MAG: ABC transporter ATP-binding protein, partial [Firmicutes bacterium]|nr:ABC transporter ATP-binding protein [Bacillota bacterium]
MNAIETHGLTKRFGARTAVDRLNLIVPQGAVYGFLGPNGAGKTTTLRMLVGLARPTEGEAFVLGTSIADGRRAYLRRIGYLPDVPGFYTWMRAPEFLKLVGRIFGLGGRELDGRVAEALDLTGLAGIKTRIGGFSRGMKQRLGLAQALINRPELVFLDEPTSALDPIGRKEVLEAIARLAGRTTVFFSTHILNDIERVCDIVGILKEGRLIAQKPIHELRASFAACCLYVEFEGEPDLA